MCLASTPLPGVRRAGEQRLRGEAAHRRCDARDRTGQILGELCKRFSVVSVRRNDPADQVEEVIYEIELKSGVTYAKLVQRLN